MTLAHPAWLILLVLLPVIGALAVMKTHARNRQWSAFVAPRLRRSLIRSASSIPRWIAFVFLFAAITSLIIGLSRPQGDTGTRSETSVGRNLLIALDLSRSMRANDVKPDRLTNAKLIVYELLEAMPNERIGLIGFAGNPYLYAPLTIDHQAVRETVEQMDETWPTVGGSDLGAAVDLGIATLRKTGQNRNALVIISDGEKHGGDVQEMIEKAKRSGVYILTIGVGTDDGEFVPHPNSPDGHMLSRDGTPVISRLQADTLRQLASETNGAYAAAGSGADLPAMIQSAIAGLDTYEMEGKERKIMIEFYQWLTLPAIVFLIASIIAGTRWRGIQTAAAKFTAGAAILILSMQITKGETSPSDPDPLADHRVKQALQKSLQLPEPLRFKGITRNGKARYQLKQALTAYQQDDFKTARQAYSLALFCDDKAMESTAHHGLGNTLFQLGWQLLSEKAYPAKPDSTPDLNAFDTLVRSYLDGLLIMDRIDSKQSYRQLKNIITNWTDSIRHYDSSLKINPNNPSVRHNRELTMVYLKRLAELMEENENQANQMMPPPQQNPQPKDGDKGDENKDNQEPKDGDNGPKKDDGSKSDQQNDQDPKQGDEKSDKESESDGNKNDKNADLKERPGETPEQRARRILKENADIEKGPLTPGYREFLEPEKDW